MNRRGIGLLVAVVAATLVAIVFFLATGTHRDDAQHRQFVDATDSVQVARGKQIYASQCAACHGAALEGQPNWRERLPNGRLPAPPHDPSGHTWHHPDAVLFDIVKYGLVPGRTAPDGYESDMPAYEKVLSDDDIIAVLAYIKSTWPDDVREMQEQVGRH